MINRTVKLFSIVLATFALACVAPTQPPKEPVSPLSPTPGEVKPAPVAKAAAYTLELTNGWKLVHGEPLVGDEPMLLGVYENEIDEDLTLVGSVIGIPLTSEQVKSFYEQMREAAHEQDGMRILKERMVKLDDRPAYEGAVVQETNRGVVIGAFVVVTDGNKVGYLVRCGGPAETAIVVLPACLKFVESFRVAK